MTSAVALTLAGLVAGLGLATCGRRDPRSAGESLRDRAIEAQRTAAVAARRARELSDRYAEASSRREG